MSDIVITFLILMLGAVLLRIGFSHLTMKDKFCRLHTWEWVEPKNGVSQHVCKVCKHRPNGGGRGWNGIMP